jgi:putative Ca2+/H+ antiporter (TMEM165/GDT1 family)
LAELAATYRKTDPQRRLQILEHARVLDQYNENIYRDIMRTQAELGLPDSVNRTLTLLTTALAEIGDQADASTVTLAQDLQHPYRQTTPQ